MKTKHIHTIKDCGFTDKELALVETEFKCGLLNPKVRCFER